MDKQDTGRAIFLSGLRNAHAVENQALEIMNRQLERIENYPEISTRLKTHIEETNGQIRRLDGILERVGESRSMLKDTALSLTGNAMAMFHALTQDEILKNSMADFAFENYEIAAYKSLIQMAQETGHLDAVAPLQESLREEEAMAQWLDQHLPGVTSAYIRRASAGDKAGL